MKDNTFKPADGYYIYGPNSVVFVENGIIYFTYRGSAGYKRAIAHSLHIDWKPAPLKLIKLRGMEYK